MGLQRVRHDSATEQHTQTHSQSLESINYSELTIVLPLSKNVVFSHKGVVSVIQLFATEIQVLNLGERLWVFRATA